MNGKDVEGGGDVIAMEKGKKSMEGKYETG